MKHTPIHLLIGSLVLASFPAYPQLSDQGNVQVVRSFVAAFNAHDSAAMSGFVAEDVQWLSVDGDTVSIETDGKTALVAAMNEYFQSCPTCQSQLTGIVASRHRLSAVETASWRGKDGPKSQNAISVYEFSGHLIRRVYYFPAEKQ